MWPFKKKQKLYIPPEPTHEFKPIYYGQVEQKRFAVEDGHRDQVHKPWICRRCRYR